MTKEQKTARTPHDIFFRAVFQMREVAMELVRNYLPADFTEELDFNYFELDRDAYLNEELKQYFSDLVYLTRLLNGKELRIAILFEHKSGSPPTELPEHIQIMNYKTAIWADDRKQKRKPTFVYPVLIHQGKTAWNERPFWAVFEGLPPSWRQYADEIKYQLIDLDRITDEIIVQKGQKSFLGTIFLTMKHAFDLEFFQHGLQKLFNFEWVKKGSLLFNPFSIALFFYLENLTGMKVKEMKKKIESPEILTSLDKITIPSVFEEGFEEGMEKGMEKGLEKGMEKRAKEVVFKLLAKFPDLSDDLIADLSGASAEFVKKGRTEIKNKEKKKK